MTSRFQAQMNQTTGEHDTASMCCCAKQKDTAATCAIVPAKLELFPAVSWDDLKTGLLDP